MKNELLDPFGIYICDLDASVLVLFKEQSHPGRKDGPEWGGVFEMNPQKRFLSQEEYGQMIEKIKAAL